MFTQTVTRALSRLGLDQRGTDPHPRQPALMLLQKADAMLSSADWTYEPKWDGFRVLASIWDGHVRLVSRGTGSIDTCAVQGPLPCPGGKTYSVEGAPPKRIIVIAFDSMETARRWDDSPAYEAINPLRHQSATARIFIVEGISP